MCCPFVRFTVIWYGIPENGTYNEETSRLLPAETTKVSAANALRPVMRHLMYLFA